MLIEYAMYFALGFLIAGLLMLMATPAFWRRAMRLSMRRLQLLAPLSREDAIAERDLLRAEFAVKERGIEQRMEAMVADKSSLMLDVGRHLARISELHEDLQAAQSTGRDLERQLSQTRTELAERTELLASTERALREATEGAKRDAVRQGELRAEHEAKIGDLHHLNSELRREYAELGEEFGRVSAEAERLAGADVSLTKASAELDALKKAKAALDEEHGKLRESTDLERERFIGEITHLENALRQTRAEARSHAEKLEALRADHALLQGATEALRGDLADRRREAGNGEATGETHDVAVLRQEIAELGASLAGSPPSPEKQRDAASA